MNLIINSDDFGISKGVNYAIIDAFSNNTLSSTTALVCGAEIAHAALIAKHYENLGVGLHLSIDFLDCISKHPLLSDEDGKFYRDNISKELDLEVVLNEWEMQIARFQELFGKMPDHFDSHHHAHILNATCQEAVKILGEKYQLPVRAMNNSVATSTLFADFYKDNLTPEHLIECIEALIKQDGFNKELMVHNAHLDQTLEKVTTYNHHRIYEHACLMSEEFKKYLESKNIVLQTFKKGVN